ncbi:MAG: class I SAM-dependent methyltransferase, partial [Planctomycetaceae bacterium]|nr:class I SAM-dependent methyltransferase [Planctomycetaceae bacterium]
MSVLINLGLGLAEKRMLPDSIVRWGIRRLLTQRRFERESGSCEDHQERLQQFLDAARKAPIAVVPEKANEQHYEVPAEFFRQCLGPQRKYSCCYYETPHSTLAQAEQKALELTCDQAELKDGQQILELGCGWGSLSLFMARRYPHSRIVAVSNSHSQRAAITQIADQEQLKNLEVITADMNEFDPPGQFDRVVSVEMFEHMRNHELLFQRIASWLNPGGKLYVHIFCHRAHPYLFLSEG